MRELLFKSLINGAWSKNPEGGVGGKGPTPQGKERNMLDIQGKKGGDVVSQQKMTQFCP